jgi:hypothetical protein
MLLAVPVLLDFVVPFLRRVLLLRVRMARSDLLTILGDFNLINVVCTVLVRREGVLIHLGIRLSGTLVLCLIMCSLEVCAVWMLQNFENGDMMPARCLCFVHVLEVRCELWMC